MSKNVAFTKKELLLLNKKGFEKIMDHNVANDGTGINSKYIEKTDSKLYPFELYFNTYEYDIDHDRYLCCNRDLFKSLKDLFKEI